MNAAGSPTAMRGGNAPHLPPKTFSISSIPPALVTRDDAAAIAWPPRRTKLWEFNTNLHCSIIGTCLSTAELRQLLKKVGLAAPDSSDHDLHGAAVSLAARHDKAAKLLHKALDERHALPFTSLPRCTPRTRCVRCGVIQSDAARSLAPTGPRSLIRRRHARSSATRSAKCTCCHIWSARRIAPT
jgi:hypothetical protein